VITGRANAVKLGSFTLKNVPVQLSLDTEGAGASEENDGLIGGEIFHRFKVTLDYSRKRMILEPNKSFNDPYISRADANNNLRDKQVKSIFPEPRRTPTRRGWTRVPMYRESVFLNLLGAAESALIRAAARTQPFGALREL